MNKILQFIMSLLKANKPQATAYGVGPEQTITRKETPSPTANPMPAGPEQEVARKEISTPTTMGLGPEQQITKRPLLQQPTEVSPEITQQMANTLPPREELPRAAFTPKQNIVQPNDQRDAISFIKNILLNKPSLDKGIFNPISYATNNPT